MIKKWPLIFVIGVFSHPCFSQDNGKDSTKKHEDQYLVLDTTLNYDLLFQDFDAFMDSILAPHSFLLANISMGRGFYSFENKNAGSFRSLQKLTYTPQLGYFHKSGFGLTATGYLVNDEEKFNLYQASISPSFDYIQDKRLVTGISYSRFITKKDLSFYTTPIQNELYAYFTYRKTWFRPTVAASYGWGSRTDYEERETQILDLRLRRNGFTYINSTETVNDFSLMVAVRHDFYWLNLFGTNDHIRLTPQFLFTSGTQKFGFNQSSNTYVKVLRTGNNVLFNSDELYLDDKLNFQPLSLGFSLRSEYSIGKFYVQPQLLLDYYFTAKEKNLNLFFSMNTGFIF